ncbi:MAG: FAD-dependent oxidoreductase [Gemmataceae bacterium]
MACRSPNRTATTPTSTNCWRASTPPAGERRSTSSTRSPTARPTPTTTGRSAPTTSASATSTRKRRTSAGARSSASTERYQQGWLYFVATDPRVPAEVRTAMQRWGLAKDEFADNGHWPRQLYIREARRLVGRFVMTEHELLKKRPTPESVGMGSYTIDSHNVQRYVTADGYVQNEGDIGVPTNGPYQISYGALVPKRGQCDNLLVPVCVSSSHIAFGSIRMEPVFMVLGQSAATAAALAIDGGTAVQEVAYPKLRARLLRDGQVLEYPAKPAPANAPGSRDAATFPETAGPRATVAPAPPAPPGSRQVTAGREDRQHEAGEGRRDAA